MAKAKGNIILIGGGGHCSSVIDVIELEGIYKIAGIVDLKEKTGQQNLGYPIIGGDEIIHQLVKEYKYFLITLGQLRTPGRRIELFNILSQYSVQMPVIVSPYAFVSKHSIIGRGSVIMHMAQVNANATVGKNCIINSKALIEHDVSVGDHCHISTGAIINGGAKIGESSFLGSGTVCREYIEIPAGSFTKANSLVK
jgi:sugar O-acyltransferase (sialic acid O-acetyltransferase NeuD family)